MTAAICPTCDRHTLPTGRTVCAPCVTHLRTQLADLPGRMDAVTDAIGRRLRFGTRVGGKSADTPVPVNMQAAENAYIARTTILAWADHIAQARREPTPDTWPTIQTFLDVRAAWLAGQDYGPAAFDELLYALRTVNRTIDRPADTHYAGPCTATTTDPDGLAADCDGELYAHPNRATVQCPRCGAEYDVAGRRAWLLTEAWDAVATGPDITRALAGDAFGGLTVNLSTLRRWAAEGKLARVDVVAGRPRYRVGDVIDLATSDRSARATRRQLA